MLKFEAIRIDPTPGEVADLVAEAVIATNRRCRSRLLEDTPAKWRKGARQLAKSAEGWEMWRAGRGGTPASQVMLSWWTDTIGRKHVVLRGQRCENYGDRVHLDRATLETRPPLWHCYPDRLVHRSTKAGAQWLAVCGCGAIGPPESLGWMGPSCGPCHDLALERGEAPTASTLPDRLTDARSELIRLAISPDGSKVAATDTSGRVHYWTLPDRSHTVVRSDITRLLPGLSQDSPLRSETLEFTGDGKTLIPDTLVRGPQLLGLDVSTDPPTEIPITAPGHAPRAILPWRDGTFCRVWPDGLEWVDPQTREPVRRIRVPMGDVWQAIPSADCSRLFVRVGNRCTVIDPDDGQILLRPEVWDRDGLLYRREYPLQIAFSTDYRTLIVAHHIRLNRIDGLTGRNLKTVIAADQPFTQTAYPASFAGLVMDPSGERFVACVNSGGLIVYQTSDLKPLADFRWHLGFVRAFATTADGQTALTGESNGTIKFWPLGRLLKTVL